MKFIWHMVTYLNESSVSVLSWLCLKGEWLLWSVPWDGSVLQDLDQPSIISADTHLFWPQRKTSPKHFVFFKSCCAVVLLSNASQTRHLAADLIHASVRQKLGLSTWYLEGLWSNLWCFAFLERKRHTPTTPAVIKGDKEDQKVQFCAQ